MIKNRRGWLLALAIVITSAHAALWASPATGPAEGVRAGHEALTGTAAADHGAEHSDPFVPILLQLGLVIFAAMLGRWMAVKSRQPAVLGELLIGVLAGNVLYWTRDPLGIVIMHLDSVRAIYSKVWGNGVSVVEAARSVFSAEQLAQGTIGQQIVEILSGPGGDVLFMLGISLWLFSNLGVILLLFMVGLESSIDEMLKVGPRALAVALVGIIVPFLLGYFSSVALLPGASSSVHLFLGATLAATSVGITARVFKDLKKLRTPEAKIVLGAAVIDDVLGLIVLAVVAGIVVTGEIRVGEVVRITTLSFVFLGAVLLIGERAVKFMLPAIAALDRERSKLLFPLLLACALAWVSDQIGLASIVGAFAAGLILNEDHFEHVGAPELKMEKFLAPLEAIFAPIFFVLMGMQVNLATFADPKTVVLGGAFVVAAIVGKLLAGYPAGTKVDRLTIGIGMIPRGEVGLIFASIGKALGVVTDGVFSAVVLMVIVTTLITPPALRWSLARSESS